ncbi:MAG TPA: tetratricopeptide repeat protein, partial [Verrucomicrobiae bacterium]|nr:tetratricopeptide repeat protein [Verrucomicrobiae bacterium]
PMLVTVPAVLLILDFWPSRRFEREQARDLIFEKVPFVVLSAATCFITLWAQKNAMAPMQQGSLWARVCNAIVCYVLYLKKLCWPSKLAVLYPEVQGWTAGVVIVCFGLLSVAAVVCAWQWRRRPWAACGFAWFLIMLIPVIGLVKVGAHLIADRYTYLPSIGLFIAVVFAAAEALPAVPGIFAAGCAFLLCALLACHQLYFWQNSFTLFRHTVAVTRNNYIALASLAHDYTEHKEVRQAHQCLKESLEIDPNFDLAWKQLSGVLKDENKLVEAAAAARRSIGINGKSFGAYASLGQIEMESGKTNEAMANYAIALKLKPDYADGHYNLANALARAGDFRGAGEHFAKAAEYDPASPDAHNNYGYVLMREGNYSAAEREFRETIRLRPASWKSHYGLAEVLRHGGDAGRAIAELEETVREKPDFAPARKMLQELRGGR